MIGQLKRFHQVRCSDFHIPTKLFVQDFFKCSDNFVCRFTFFRQFGHEALEFGVIFLQYSTKFIL